MTVKFNEAGHHPEKAEVPERRSRKQKRNDRWWKKKKIQPEDQRRERKEDPKSVKDRSPTPHHPERVVQIQK